MWWFSQWELAVLWISSFSPFSFWGITIFRNFYLRDPDFGPLAFWGHDFGDCSFCFWLAVIDAGSAHWSMWQPDGEVHRGEAWRGQTQEPLAAELGALWSTSQGQEFLWWFHRTGMISYWLSLLLCSSSLWLGWQWPFLASDRDCPGSRPYPAASVEQKMLQWIRGFVSGFRTKGQSMLYQKMYQTPPFFSWLFHVSIGSTGLGESFENLSFQI